MSRTVRRVCMTLVVDACHCTFVQTHECTPPRESPHVNCGLGVIIMCPCGVISHKCATLIGDMGIAGMWKISLPSIRFCFEPKTALKSKSYFKKCQK